MSKGKFYFSKSLEKGFRILSLFNRETPTLTQSEIAKILNLNMTTTYRYINTLVELGYLEKDAQTKVIRPAILCLQFCSNLMRAADNMHLIQGVIDGIHKKHNISIDAAFVVGDSIVRIYHKSAAETLTYRLPDSSRNCLHNTALGKAYLSSLEPKLLKQKIKKMVLSAKTPHTITDKSVLMDDLATAHKQGYIMSVEEFLPGLIAIGAPLWDPRNGKAVGAVSFDFSVIQKNADRIEKDFAELIQEVARSLSDLVPPDHNKYENVA